MLDFKWDEMTDLWTAHVLVCASDNEKSQGNLLKGGAAQALQAGEAVMIGEN